MKDMMSYEEKNIYKLLLTKLQEIEERKKMMPQDMLGRTLAYNCFLPRLADTEFLYKNFRSIHSNTDCKAHQGVFVQIDDLSRIVQKSVIEDNSDIEKEILCVFVDDTCSKENHNAIDYLSMLRRLMPIYVAYNGIILDTYQILESAIAGADMIVLDILWLRAYMTCTLALQNNPSLFQDKDEELDWQDFLSHVHVLRDNENMRAEIDKIVLAHLNTLVAFAYNLGIIPIFHARNADDLQILHSLQNPIDCVMVPPSLIQLLADSYLVFTTTDDIMEYKISNTSIPMGIDVLLENIILTP